MAGHPADPDRAGGRPRRARGRRRRGAALAGRRRYDGAAAAGEPPLPSASGPFDGRGGAPMRLWALRNRLRELFGLPPVPPRPGSAAVPGAPRVEVTLAGAVPGAVVRLLPPVLVVAGAALSGATGFAWYLTALAAIAVTWWPRYPWAAIVVGFFGLWLFGRDDLLALDAVAGTVPGLWRMAALVLTVHLLLVGTALAAHVAWRSLVETGVLLRGARTVLATQAIAQSVLLLVAWLRAWQPVGQEWLPRPQPGHQQQHALRDRLRCQHRAGTPQQHAGLDQRAPGDVRRQRRADQQQVDGQDKGSHPPQARDGPGHGIQCEQVVPAEQPEPEEADDDRRPGVPRPPGHRDRGEGGQVPREAGRAGQCRAGYDEHGRQQPDDGARHRTGHLHLDARRGGHDRRARTLRDRRQAEQLPQPVAQRPQPHRCTAPAIERPGRRRERRLASCSRSVVPAASGQRSTSTPAAASSARRSSRSIRISRMASHCRASRPRVRTLGSTSTAITPWSIRRQARAMSAASASRNVENTYTRLPADTRGGRIRCRGSPSGRSRASCWTTRSSCRRPVPGRSPRRRTPRSSTATRSPTASSPPRRSSRPAAPGRGRWRRRAGWTGCRSTSSGPARRRRGSPPPARRPPPWPGRRESCWPVRPRIRDGRGSAGMVRLRGRTTTASGASSPTGPAVRPPPPMPWCSTRNSCWGPVRTDRAVTSISRCRGTC